MKSIGIIGNDMAAWMAAAFFAVQPASHRPSISIFTGVSSAGDSLIQNPMPDFSGFLSLIGVSDQQFISACAATPTLGTCYHNFPHYEPTLGPDNCFYHSWGEYGSPLGAIEFHQLNIRAMHESMAYDLNDLSVAALAAQKNRFMPPSQDPRSIRATYETSYSFQTKNYIQLLQQICRSLAVQEDSRPVEKLLNHSEGYVIEFASGEHAGADFLVNTCPVLRHQITPYNSWQEFIPFTQVTRKNTAQAQQRLVSDVGFDHNLWRITRYATALQETTCYGLPDESVGEESADLFSGCVANPRAHQLLHLGRALINLHSPLVCEVDLIWVALRILQQFYPACPDGPSVVSEYNQRLIAAYENLRDLSQAVFIQTERKFPGTLTVINHCKISSPLQHKLDLFAHRGKLPAYENEVYKRQWQLWLLLGLGVVPSNVESITFHLSQAEMRNVFDRIKAAVTAEVETWPSVK